MAILFNKSAVNGESAGFRDKYFGYVVIANTAINRRNGDQDKAISFDELLYEQRHTIERTNA